MGDKHRRVPLLQPRHSPLMGHVLQMVHHEFRYQFIGTQFGGRAVLLAVPLLLAGDILCNKLYCLRASSAKRVVYCLLCLTVKHAVDIVPPFVCAHGAEVQVGWNRISRSRRTTSLLLPQTNLFSHTLAARCQCPFSRLKRVNPVIYP